MIASRRRRFLAIMLMATWSPGHWCCCQGQAAEETAPAALDADCHADSCCGSRSAADRQPAKRPAGCGGGQPCGERPDSESCGCIDAPLDAIAPSAVAAPDHGAAGCVDLLIELPSIFATPAAASPLGSTCRGSPPPGAQSLLSLHCQLTT